MFVYRGNQYLLINKCVLCLHSKAASDKEVQTTYSVADGGGKCEEKSLVDSKDQLTSLLCFVMQK